MQFRKTLLIALVLLPGCSAPEDSQRRVIGNGAYVSIFNVPNEISQSQTPTPSRTRARTFRGVSGYARNLEQTRPSFQNEAPG